MMSWNLVVLFIFTAERCGGTMTIFVEEKDGIPGSGELFASSRSLIDCASQCSKNDHCRRIFFDSDTSECHYFKNTVNRADKDVPTFGKSEMYLGCYRDDILRDMPIRLQLSEANSKNVCMAECFKIGYKYSGLQYTDECWCGSSYGRYGQIPEAECNMPCPGNSEAVCGGDLAASIYYKAL